MTLGHLALLCSALLCVFVVPVAPKSSESSPSNNRPWAPAFYDALKAKDSVVFALKSMERVVTVKKVRKVMRSLDELVSKIDGLNILDTDKIEGDLTLMGKLIHYNTGSIANRLFRSDFLTKDYNREMGRMLRAFQGHHNFRCLQALWSSPNSLKGFDFPIDYMCFKVERKLLKPQSHSFSTDKICHDVKQCSAGGDSGPDKTHPYDETPRKVMTNVKDACQDDGQTCNVKKAVSMMGGLLWFKTSKFMARSLCQNYLKKKHPRNKQVYNQDTLTTELNDIKEMARLVMAYASTLNWKLFFEEAIQRRAYSNLQVALGLIREYERSFSSSKAACYELKADDVCIYGNINIEYQSIRKIQKYRRNPGKTRNLRLFQRTNHAKMVELKQGSLDYIQMLGNIRSVDENLGEATKGLKNYLVKLAEYDQGIAEQDVIFLAGKLDDFETESTKTMAKVKKGLSDVFIAAVSISSLKLADEGAQLAAQIAEVTTNPFKLIFGGVPVGEVLEQIAVIAQATADVAKVSRMLDTLSETLKNTVDLSKKLKNNADQIEKLQIMIDAIKTNSMDQIGADADLFVEAYGNYTPRVDKSDLEADDALWGAFKETACDVLYGADGVLAGAAQIPIKGMLMCENLEGTLAEYFALRENIFDFQFDLVDSLARVVRGNIAKKLAETIKTPNAPLQASQLMLGYFMTQNRLQSSASLYCDKLEYLNQGEKIPICSPRIGLFLRRTLDDLIAYKPDTTYHLDERFVYIPTRAQFNGDTGFINWQTLKKGEAVTFRLPANQTWLRQFNWISKNNKKVVPFVQSFKLYLPRKTYDSNSNTYSKTHIRLTSIASSAVGKGDVAYNLPIEHSQYLTAYSEGFNPSRCPSGGNIANPYSLCDNLPNICDTTTRVVGTSLMPTILSTWKLTYLTETSTIQKLSWDAPDPATNLLVVAKVKLRFPSSHNSKRSKVPSMDTPAKLGCCTGNNYRPNWYGNTCIACPVKPDVPQDSKINLQGYYCEKGQQ